MSGVPVSVSPPPCTQGSLLHTNESLIPPKFTLEKQMSFWALTERGEGPQAGEQVQVHEIPRAFAACGRAMSSC